MTNQPRPANRILTALPHEEFERLRPKLREINFHIGETVYLPEQKMDYAYFVNSGIVSWLAAVENGNTVEAGVIGPEGIAGVAIVLGANSTPNQGLAQSEVQASRIAAKDLIAEIDDFLIQILVVILLNKVRNLFYVFKSTHIVKYS